MKCNELEQLNNLHPDLMVTDEINIEQDVARRGDDGSEQTTELSFGRCD